MTNFREFSDHKHATVDDYPYGGGAGMVLKPQPIFDAVEAIKQESSAPKVILVCPQGETYTQKKRKSLQRKIILCSFADIMKAMTSG